MLAMLLLPSSCYRLDASTAAHAVALAQSGSSAAGSFCATLGGRSACMKWCDSLHADSCWNAYLDGMELGGIDRLQAWMVLTHTQQLCLLAAPVPTCTDRALLEPLTTSHLLERLCAPECSAWPAWANETLSLRLPGPHDRALLCSRRADNAFCATVANESTPCDLLWNGCASVHEAALTVRLGSAAAAAAQKSLDMDACAREQPPGLVALSVPPPAISSSPIGIALRAQVWQVISASLGVSGSAGGEDTTASDGGGTFFSRIEYHVTVGGQRHRVSGLVAEPIGVGAVAAPARGVALFFHGTRGPGDSAISYLPATSPHLPCLNATACSRRVLLVQPEHTLVRGASPTWPHLACR